MSRQGGLGADHAGGRGQGLGEDNVTVHNLGYSDFIPHIVLILGK